MKELDMLDALDEVEALEEQLDTAVELLDEVLCTLNNIGMESGLQKRIRIFLNRIEDNYMS